MPQRGAEQRGQASAGAMGHSAAERPRGGFVLSCAEPRLQGLLGASHSHSTHVCPWGG